MGKGIITTEQRQKQIISRLKNDNQNLRIKVEILEKENKDLREKLENVLLRVAELEEIIFGKKKKKDRDGNDKNKRGDTGDAGPKHEGVAATNNKAERKLRHIVLKRKNCFGSKTEKGNMMMETNMSVLLSLWWNSREQFFPKFKELMG